MKDAYKNMHVLNTKSGGFIFPYEAYKTDDLSKEKQHKDIEPLGELNGYGGSVYKIVLSIPTGEDSFDLFRKKISQNEQTFQKIIASTFHWNE